MGLIDGYAVFISIYDVSSLPQIIAVMSFFFFNDTATTEIYTLSLHDALPIYRSICLRTRTCGPDDDDDDVSVDLDRDGDKPDRKSTRLNSSHLGISYAVFCMKQIKTREHQRKYGG